jgi:5-methylcytosine-specific restriction endonuclease McrA
MTGEKTSSGCHYWRCVCDCKNEICVPGNNLEIGHTRSCGCLHREITSARRGELHPGWKSSRSQKDRLYRRQYPEYYAWRNRIFERDSFICRVCGISRSDQMVAHHLYSYAKYKDLQLNVNNGITLCSDCHNGFHEWHGGITQACTKGDFSNWLIANGYTTVDIMVTDVAP